MAFTKLANKFLWLQQNKNGATFVAWIKNNLGKISEEKTYTFTASSSTEGKYTAVFGTHFIIKQAVL